MFFFDPFFDRLPFDQTTLLEHIFLIYYQQYFIDLIENIFFLTIEDIVRLDANEILFSWISTLFKGFYWEDFFFLKTIEVIGLDENEI